ncbi:MAG: zf-HC2 domain-containing protein [Planctomycetota bacterium]
MKSDCDKMRERIGDLVSAVLSDVEVNNVESHLLECRACRAYAAALRQEDRLLREMVEDLDSAMTEREQAAIRMINSLDVSRDMPLVWKLRQFVESTLARHLATAAVIVVVTLYFIISLSWVSEINKCLYELAM